MTQTQRQIEAIISQLVARRSAIRTRGETHLREEIRPIFGALGWGAGQDDIIAEYRTGGGKDGNDKVDWCLQVNRTPKVIIEAKAPRERLDNHQKQIESYAYAVRAPIAVLTNGFEWRFYLPMVANAKWEDCEFERIELAKDSHGTVESFVNILSRSSVQRREVEQHAEEIVKTKLKHQQIERAMEELLPRLDIVAQVQRAIEAETSHEVTGEEVMEQLIAYLSQNLHGDSNQIKTPGAQSNRSAVALKAWSTRREKMSKRRSEKQSGSRTRRTATKPEAFYIDAHRHDDGVKDWVDILMSVCGILLQEFGETMFRDRLSSNPTTRTYVKIGPQNPKRYKRVGRTDLWVYTKLNGDHCVQRAREIIKTLGGSDRGFRTVPER